MNELVKVEGVTKLFKDRRVLDDVSFSVRQGEVLGLIGPNGAGKTTLFECLAGLLPANGGTIKSHAGRVVGEGIIEELRARAKVVSPRKPARFTARATKSLSTT